MSCTIQISYEVIYSWHEVFFPLDCFIRLRHVNTDPHFSGFLGEDNNGANPGCGALNSFDDIQSTLTFQAPFKRLHAHERESCGVGCCLGVMSGSTCNLTIRFVVFLCLHINIQIPLVEILWAVLVHICDCGSVKRYCN